MKKNVVKKTKDETINERPFFDEVRAIVDVARKYAYSAVNTAMVQAYWLIGKRIVEEEQQGKKRAEYGENLIKNLSAYLTEEFGKGFSLVNIKSFRLFYLTFSGDHGIHHTPCDKSFNSPKSDTVRSFSEETENSPVFLKGHTACALLENTEKIPFLGQLSWSHYRQIMRVADPKARYWYLKETAECRWSVRTLDRNIATQYYERLLISQVREPVVAEMEEKTSVFQANKLEFIKNPAVLESSFVRKPIMILRDTPSSRGMNRFLRQSTSCIFHRKRNCGRKLSDKR